MNAKGLQVFEQLKKANYKKAYVMKNSFGAGKVEGYLIGSAGAFIVETMSSLQNGGGSRYFSDFGAAKDLLASKHLLVSG